MSSIKTKKQKDIKKTAQFYYKLKLSFLLSDGNISDEALKKLLQSNTFFSERSVNWLTFLPLIKPTNTGVYHERS